MPPLSVRPATPVSEISPPGVAKPKCLGLAVDIAPGGSTLDPGVPPFGIDAHAAHQRKIDHHAAVAHGVAGNIVGAAADRDRQMLASRQILPRRRHPPCFCSGR